MYSNIYRYILYNYYFLKNTLVDYINSYIKLWFDLLFNNNYNKEIICKVEYFNIIDLQSNIIYKRSIFAKILDCFAISHHSIELFDLDIFLDDAEFIIKNKNTYVYFTFLNGKKLLFHLNDHVHHDKCVYSAITDPIHKEITIFLNEHLFMCNKNNVSVSTLIKIMLMAGFINKNEYNKLNENEEVKLLILDCKYKEHNLSYNSVVSF
jgi:hypothetical protein